LTLYAMAGHSWVLFAMVFLVPDVSFVAYLAGPRVGAVVYNALHSYAGPALLAGTLALVGQPVAIPLVWIAHIGLDRCLGYGLKYGTAFGDTHLGRLTRSVEAHRTPVSE
jgi:hypothetical protein